MSGAGGRGRGGRGWGGDPVVLRNASANSFRFRVYKKSVTQPTSECMPESEGPLVKLLAKPYPPPPPFRV